MVKESWEQESTNREVFCYQTTSPLLLGENQVPVISSMPPAGLPKPHLSLSKTVFVECYPSHSPFLNGYYLKCKNSFAKEAQSIEVNSRPQRYPPKIKHKIRNSKKKLITVSYVVVVWLLVAQ